MNMFSPFSSNSHDFWCDENSASASADDVDYFFDEALSVETEDDVPDEFGRYNCSFDSARAYHGWSGLPFVDLEEDLENESNPTSLRQPNYDNPFPVPAPVKREYENNGLTTTGRESKSALEQPAKNYTGFLKPGEFLVPPKPIHFVPKGVLDSNSDSNNNTTTDCNQSASSSLKPDPYEVNENETSVDGKESKSPKKRKPSFPRKQFRETVGAQIYRDLMSEQYSYDEIIAKYSALYPEYASKFTPSFCSKVRCGRIMNPEASKVKGITKPKSRVKRVSKLSHRKTWRKMTPELFAEISEWEKNQKRPVKQVEFEQIFNVNRSTYYRWKKSQSKTSFQTKNFDN